MNFSRVILRTASRLLDLTAALCLAVVGVVGVSGGGVLQLLDVHISVTSTGNPVAFAALVSAARYWLAPMVPLLGTRSLTPLSLQAGAWRLIREFQGAEMSRSTARLLLSGVLTLSIGLRLINAANPGFITGDDVELHELTLSVLFDHEWPVWNLRNAFYPMTFLYPARALAFRGGFESVGDLVLAGRLAAIAVGSATIVLVYRIARALGGGRNVAVLASVIFATSRLHLWFGSTELPRPVAAVFIASAFLALLRRGPWRTAGAGVLLGVGGSLRFGELLFFVPATWQLLIERRLRELFVMAAAGAVTTALVLGVSDAVYWGQAFSSFRNIIDYTIVEGQSSRGFQPFWHYLSLGDGWTNVVVLLLGFYALRLENKRAALWGWSIVLLLSMLPHKEARYLIAALPFLCVTAAFGAQDIATRILARRLQTAALALGAAILLSLSYELSSWHVRRSDDAVAVARDIARRGASGIAAPQLWRFGGRLYWQQVPSLQELPTPVPASFSVLPSIDTLILPADANASTLSRAAALGFERVAPPSDGHVVLRRQRPKMESRGRT